MFISQLKKVPGYCIGLLILALGVAFAVKSNLGVSPITSIGYVLSVILQLDLGISVTISYLGFMAVQILLLGRSYRWHNLLQLASSFLFGIFVDFAGFLVSWIPTAETWPVQILFCLINILFVALGLYIYTHNNLLSLPSEGLMGAIASRLHIKIGNAKLIQDGSVVGLSLVLSLLCLGRIDGLGLGTVLTALGVGNVLKFIDNMWQKMKSERETANA